MTRDLLRIKNLSLDFSTKQGKVQALKNVSFHIPRGQTLGFVGESGAGKSVTALSIMRLLNIPPARISSGEILLEDKDLLKLSEREMQKIRGNRISMIFQEPMTSLNPVFTVGYQIVETLILHQKLGKKQAWKKAADLLDRVEIAKPQSRLKSYPHEMSGGQRQRVMIAMAIACEPDLLIADEPTTSLDGTTQKQILKLMMDLQKQYNTSLLFITHDLSVVGEIADQVVVMHRGEIVEQGPVISLFKNPKRPYTKGLLICRPSMESSHKRLITIQDVMEEKIGTKTSEKKESQLKVPDPPKAPDSPDNRNQVLTSFEKTSSDFSQKSSGDKSSRHDFKISGELDFEKKLFTDKKEKPLLEVKNIKKYYPSRIGLFGKVKTWVKAVDDVSLRVHRGHTLGLVGESGCGKTTLGRTILRLVDPLSGEIWYEGQDLLALKPKQIRRIRRKMQMIFQDPYASLNPRMKVGSAIMEPMKIHHLGKNQKERLERAVFLMEKVGLTSDHLNRYPHEFSGGQRQRVCIARVLAVEPDFIICDESVSALDVSIQAQILNLLMDLQDEMKLTYIFISHDLAVVKFFSDEVAVMNQGRIVEMAKAVDIYNKPQNEYTKKLLDSIPRGVEGRKF